MLWTISNLEANTYHKKYEGGTHLIRFSHVFYGKYKWNESKISCNFLAGIEWSPRIDVAESEGKFVMTVEVPGVSISDIRVEVDDQK